MFANLMNKTVTLYRLRKKSTTGDDQYKEVWGTGSSILCAIQPASSEDTAMTEGQYGKTFKLFCERGVTIQVGDKLVYGDKTFMVRGVQDYDYGRNSHKEVVIHEPRFEEEPITIADVYLLEDGGKILIETGDELLIEA